MKPRRTIPARGTIREDEGGGGTMNDDEQDLEEESLIIVDGKCKSSLTMSTEYNLLTSTD